VRNRRGECGAGRIVSTTCLLPDGFENAVDGANEFVPTTGLAGELLAADGGEAIEAGFAIVFGGAPLGADPTAVLEAVEGRVQRAMFNLEDFVGAVFDDMGDGMAMSRTEEKRLQDQKIEGALKEVGFERRGSALGHCEKSSPEDDLLESSRR